MFGAMTANGAVPVAAFYNESMRSIGGFVLFTTVWGFSGCISNLSALPEHIRPDAPIVGADKPTIETDKAIVMGRALTVLLGPTTRWYGPHVRFVELINRSGQQRYQVMIESEDRHFILELPPGDYELSRVQISEGPFMSLADLHEMFTVLPGRITYVGTWRFGIDIPKYGRKVLVSIIQDDESRWEVERHVMDQHPEWADRPTVTALPDPIAVESRLYEVASYPRIPRYFRRHWW